MIQTTEAIVLTSKNYSESSKIIHLFSKEFGKFSAIAKGATNPKSKFGKILQPTNYLQITFYQKSANQLQLLTDAEIVENFWNLHTNLEKSAYSLAIIETIHKLFEDYYPNKRVFELIIRCYQDINTSENSPNSYFIYFLINLMDYSGYTMDINESFILYENHSIFFDLANGCLTLTKPNNYFEISKDTLGKIFAIKTSANKQKDFSLTNKEFFQLIKLFQKYIKEHTDKSIFWDSLGILQ